MTKKVFSPEFKQEAASLVLDQNYTQAEACESMGVGRSAMYRWVKQLSLERTGQSPKTGKAITEEHQEIQELKRYIKRLETERSILKKATALLMSDQFNG